MMTTQFLIVLLIFNIPNSFCRYSLEAEESFVELGLFQRILYEYNEQLAGSHSCWHMIVSSDHSAYGVQPIFPNGRCQGGIGSCAWAGKVTACRSTVGRTKIQWSDETRYRSLYLYPPGHGDACPKEKAMELYQTNEYHSVCYCHCTQTNWGIHLGKMQSREHENYVIIGIRFILRDNVLYLQPAEGKLGAGLQISESAWVPLPLEPSEIRHVDSNSANFFLDDLILDNGYAVTGIEFIHMTALKPSQVSGFGIRVSGRPYSNGGDLVLRPGNTLVIQPDPSTERYTASDLPALMDKVGRSLSKLSPVNHEYVKLKLSDIHDDYEQTTVPLFHNPRVTDHHKLLSGFGIFLETSESKEQFISLRLHVWNFPLQLPWEW